MTEDEIRAKRSASAKKAAATRALNRALTKTEKQVMPRYVGKAREFGMAYGTPTMGTALVQEAAVARTRATFRHYAVRGKLARHLLSSAAYPRILGPMMRPANAQIHTYRMER